MPVRTDDNPRVGRILAAVVVAAAFLSGSSGAAGAAADPMRVSADWILSAQLADGAITISPGSTAIWPYLANQAAAGLARASEATGDPRYVVGAWAWLAWYQAHEAPGTGFVTDYTVTGASEQSTGKEDSTDAYAGMFLWAVDAAFRADPTPARLASLHAGVLGAVGAIEATQDVDGLTFATPGWHVKYLMDQSETYAGLSATVPLALALGDNALAARAGADAARLKAGVASLWDPGDGAYDWALHGQTGHQRTTWSVLYPDAQEQLWAVAYGLADATKAATLLDHFNAAHPAWDQPTATDENGGSPRPVGYQTVVAIAFARAGRSAQAGQALTRIEAAAAAAGRAWPFTPGDAGQLLILAAGSLSPVPAPAAPALAVPSPPRSIPTAVAAPRTVSLAATVPPVPAPSVQARTGSVTNATLRPAVDPSARRAPDATSSTPLGHPHLAGSAGTPPALAITARSASTAISHSGRSVGRTTQERHKLPIPGTDVSPRAVVLFALAALLSVVGGLCLRGSGAAIARLPAAP